jgi:hypothetical protein
VSLKLISRVPFGTGGDWKISALASSETASEVARIVENGTMSEMVAHGIPPDSAQYPADFLGGVRPSS